METGVIGRGIELDRLAAFLEDDAPLPRALLLHGEAGIGKTTIWREGIRQARELGRRVATAQPAESEAGLPYAALADLLDSSAERDLQELPAAQRHAIGVAIQQEGTGEEANQLAVSLAALALVRSMSREAPLVIGLDEAQWLDAPSSKVLSFVVRRLDGCPVRLLVARRGENTDAAPLDLDRSLGDQFETLVIGPLTLTALDPVLRGRLGIRLARPRLVELHRACGGNPFYAIEIARSLDPSSDGGVIAVPGALGAVLKERIKGLPQQASDAALLTAACIQPTVRLVERAAGSSAGLAAARDHEILEVEGDRLRFTHPLLVTATYAAAAPWERRDAHARLAKAAESALERAHHLALSTEDPDEAVAAELATAAAEASRRGGSESAAGLAEHATRLTPGDAERRARAVTAAEYRLMSGDSVGARTTFEEISAELPAGGERARIVARLADLISADDPERALQLGRQALDEANGELALSVEIHLDLATTTWNMGALRTSTDHVRAALALAETAGDDALIAMSLGELLHCEMMLGMPLSEEAALRALSLERSLEHLPLASYFRPSIQLGIAFTGIDRLDEARPLLEAELARAVELGDEAIRWGVQARMSDLELRTGNLGEAVRHAREALELVRLHDYPALEPFALAQLAAATAHIGDDKTTREAALAVLEQPASHLTQIRARGALGLLELSLGRPEEAWTWLEPAVDELLAMNVGELSIFGVPQNATEALVAVGQLERATQLNAWVEEKGRPARRPWHRAIAARGRALVSAAGGDYGGARVALGEAFAAHADVPQPFELARTLLVQGQIERRAKRRALARDALTGALEIFDSLGAGLWAEKTAAELARISGRPRSSGDLTETERRVAGLVVEGRSNKEVAAKLFVSVRAVEANLSKIYAKLGVRSRTELASRLSRRVDS